MDILVTSYSNPDLDGTASAIGYAEFLRKNNKDAIVAIFGKPHREAQFALRTFNIPTPLSAEKLIPDVNKIVIVDASSMTGLVTSIDPCKVIEIIDHRKSHDAYEFSNAKIQIEQVGSAATLVAERFYNSKTEISEASAALLFSAIVSNTINFKAKVTTERDHKMADWLKTKFFIPNNYVYEMFADKSKFNIPLKDVIIEDFAPIKLSVNFGIAQLEIINVEDFIKKNLAELKSILLSLKKERKTDVLFLTCIDIEKGFNMLVVVDDRTKNMLEKVLKVKFSGDIARCEGIMMRKEMFPLIKEAMEKEKN
jgi:inorganic pyrophosphatase/exopolyphosphatase